MGRLTDSIVRPFILNGTGRVYVSSSLRRPRLTVVRCTVTCSVGRGPGFALRVGGSKALCCALAHQVDFGTGAVSVPSLSNDH